MLETVEVASYPKSGNTWLSAIISEYCLASFNEQFRIKGILRSRNEIDAGAADLPVNENGTLRIYKSHKRSHQDMTPDRIIHIMRHPLDVFFSARNFLYLKAELGQKHAFNKFIDGKPKTVEQIIQDGELPYYFDEFCEQVGRNYWPGMLGDESHYFTYIENALADNRVATIRYEDLLTQFNSTASVALKHVFGRYYQDTTIDKELVDKKTKDGNRDKKFFWRAKSGTFKDFLTQQQIDHFYALHESSLKKLKYL